MQTIANRKVTLFLLEKYDLKAKKHLGQNFIIDPSVVINIAIKSQVNHETTVLEIGPGLGSLTQQLALRSKKVYAIEIDKDMVEILQNELSLDNVIVIHEDFLDIDLSQFQSMPISVVANVPYYITTPILFKLIESDLNLISITMMIQKELANRLNAQVNTKDYNALSVMIRYLFEVKTILQIPKQCFHPIPKVDSSVIQLIPTPRTLGIDHRLFFEFVKRCFQMKRKTLANNLRDHVPLKQLFEALSLLNLSRDVRAESLNLGHFIDLYRRLYEGSN